MITTLVFIHGWASSPDVWIGQKEYFSKDFEVILPDISRAKDIKEAAAIIGESVSGREDFVYIGWSLGFLAALESLKNPGKKPKGLVSVNSTPKFVDDGYLGAGPTQTHLLKMSRDLRKNPEKTLEGFYRQLLSDSGSQMLSGFNFSVGAAFMRPVQAGSSGAINRAPTDELKTCISQGSQHLIYGLEMLKAADYRDFIGSIDFPVLIIAGSKDTVCPQEASIYMNKKIKGSRLEILDCGHLPFLSKKEEFNQLITDFAQEL